MAGFNAAAVVEPLEYDFSRYCGARVKGEIQEPTDAQIARFLEDIKAFYSKIAETQAQAAKLAEETNGEALFDALNNLDIGVVFAHMSEMSEIYARLCSDRPTAEQIQKLPFRVRSHFFAWLQGEVVNPEVGTGAGNAPVVRLDTARTA